jgi:hypothetical protein
VGNKLPTLQVAEPAQGVDMQIHQKIKT